MAKNIIGSSFFLAFSLFYFYNVFSIKKMPGGHFEVMTASTFPYYIGLSGIIISSLLLLLSFIKKDDDILSMEYLKTLDFKTVMLFVATMIFYGFTIRSLGFIIATIIFLASGFIFLKETNKSKIAMISIGVSVGFYIILVQLLGIYIEPGLVAEYFLGESND